MAVTNPSRRGLRAEPRTERISLSRGPALILGTILLAAGLYFIYKQHTFPKFSQFPNGTAHVDGKVIFNLFGGNGWTGMLTAVCGGLLLFGAAQHHLAKTMSLIVGVVLAAAAVIGLVNHGNVLGLASSNHLTELAWGIAAVILLFNTLMPARRRVIEPVVVEDGAVGRGPRRRHTAEAAAAGAGAGALAEHEHEKHRERREAERGDVDPERGHGHTGEAAAAGAGAGALAEHEHDKHREQRAEDATAVQDRGAGEGTAPERRAGEDAGQTREAQGPGQTGATGPGEAGADGPADQREPVGATHGSPSGEEDPGLAERAKRLFKPGSGS